MWRNCSVAVGGLWILLGASSYAFAYDCSNSNQQVKNSSGQGNQALTNTIQGNTICVNAGGPMQQWQEYHRTGGVLVEWHKGGNTIEDPAGQWSIANDRITYTFGPKSYTYELRGGPANAGPGAGYSICGVAGTTFSADAEIRAGQVGCGY